jgi:hypothetical protein
MTTQLGKESRKGLLARAARAADLNGLKQNASAANLRPTINATRGCLLAAASNWQQLRRFR